jgi:hypothetical protein
MSNENYLYNSESKKSAFVPPHLMFYAPYKTAKDVGYESVHRFHFEEGPKRCKIGHQEIAGVLRESVVLFGAFGVDLQRTITVAMVGRMPSTPSARREEAVAHVQWLCCRPYCDRAPHSHARECCGTR